uniref:Beta-1,3-glucan recognition protein 3 n=1 Tax=Delias nigrina TaxID=127180 RepID=B7SVL7_9NEOP|nr:beta-1,3-glucan recognition protein 3 [Delias nigrina]
MALIGTGLFVAFVTFSTIYAQNLIPTAEVQAIKPRGIKVFLPDNEQNIQITSFVFDGILYKENSPISPENVVTRIWGFGSKLDNQGWLFHDPDVVIKQDQRIYYHIYVSTGYGEVGEQNHDGIANFTLPVYQSERRFYVVNSLADASARGPDCHDTATKVRGKRVCAGDTIFVDNFDNFREDLWQIAHYIPIDHPEHPFVSYQRLQKDPTVTVVNGTLRISPKLQQDLFQKQNKSILSGTLDLTSGCTELRTCSMSSIGVDIVPPIVSGRVTSARFAFTYGTILIRAKLPQGDWLYPEILLEPLSKKYGTLNYASGVLKVAMARGNIDVDNERYSNNWLIGGPILNSRCRSALEFYHSKINGDRFWGDEFHEYALTWTPEEIVLKVDGEEWGRYTPGATGLRSWLPASCRGDWFELLNNGGIMAPFDDHFYITLGVAVGGIVEFTDGLSTGEKIPKPWRNRGRKASFSFWQDKENWYPTWTDPDLVVDYVKVIAL